MKPSYLGILALGLVAFISSANAQSIPITSGGIDLSPSTHNPQPGQSVTITARSYAMDIDSASVIWTSNGVVLERGLGIKTITVKAPAIGKTTTLRLSAITPSGESFEGQLVLSSGSIDLIVEPQGYAPSVFPGKNPVGYQNTVKIIAVPHLANSSGTEYDPRSLVYSWEHNGKILQDQSGYGKQSVTISGNLIPRPYQVIATVSTRDGSAQAMTAVSVAPTKASVVFYKNDPLYGPLYNIAVGDSLFIGSQKETSIVAVPFGFNSVDPDNDGLRYKWLINNRLRDELSSGRTVTLRAPEGQGGVSNIELEVTSASDILQSARATLRALFGNTTTDNQTAF